MRHPKMNKLLYGGAAIAIRSSKFRCSLYIVSILSLLSVMGIVVQDAHAGRTGNFEFWILNSELPAGHREFKIQNSKFKIQQVPQDAGYMTLEGSLDTFGSLPTNPSSGDTVNTG